MLPRQPGEHQQCHRAPLPRLREPENCEPQSQGPSEFALHADGILITERGICLHSQISLLSSVFLCSDAFPKARAGTDLRVKLGLL